MVRRNSEGDHDFVRVRLADIGARPLGVCAKLQLRGKRIGLLHGTHEEIVDSLTESGGYDLIVRGHSHKPEITEGETLVVNPGEVCGYLIGRREPRRGIPG